MSTFIINRGCCRKTNVLEKPVEFFSVAYDIKLWTESDRLTIYSFNGGDFDNFDLYREGDDFLFSIGPMFFDGLSGLSAVKKLFRDFHLIRDYRPRISGHFILVAFIDNKLTLMNDELNASKIFYSRNFKLISDSLPLIAYYDFQSNEINRQGIYEYIFNGCTFGKKTILKNISSVSNNAGLVIVRHSAREQSYDLAVEEETLGASTSCDGLIEQCKSQLQEVMSGYHSVHNRTFRVALSGGFDSRLLLALFLANDIRPELFVYGDQDDTDVLVAAKICKKLGLPLDIVNKNNRYSAIAKNSASTDMLEEIYWRYGACPYLGIYNKSVDFLDRISRASGRKILVNGSGGEIFRHFYYLPNKPISKYSFIKSFHCRFRKKWVSQAFSEEEYVQTFKNLLDELVNNRRSNLHRNEVDSLYHLLRVRYWSSHDMLTNQNFGTALYPFLENSVIRSCRSISYNMRLHGKFESQLICSLNQEIASVTSSYGHTLDRAAPIGYRLKMMHSYHRPLWLRGRLFKFRGAIQNEGSGVINLIENSEPTISKPYNVRALVDLDKIDDPHALNRALTVEYFIQRNNISI